MHEASFMCLSISFKIIRWDQRTKTDQNLENHLIWGKNSNLIFIRGSLLIIKSNKSITWGFSFRSKMLLSVTLSNVLAIFSNQQVYDFCTCHLRMQLKISIRSLLPKSFLYTTHTKHIIARGMSLNILKCLLIYIVHIQSHKW